MSAPLVVSPYVRPFVERGRLVYDNGITGEVHRLEPVAEAVLRALWTGASAAAQVTQLATRFGTELIGESMEELADACLLFESTVAAETAFHYQLDTKQPRTPFVDQVELTNICPMRCGFCPRGIDDGITRPTGRMELSLFETLLDQLHPAQNRYRPLELHHLGESLVHPEVDDFVRAASHRGLPTELSVNPALLSPELGARLLAAGIGRVVVSLDGMDDETLIGVRGPAARYSRARPNLEAFLAGVAAMSQPPQVVIQMIELKRNRHQRESFVATWGNIGLPTVSAYIKPLDGADPDTGVTNAEPLTYLCSYPWRSVVVLWDGRVVPCCRDADAALVLGNLHDQGLEAIWNGGKARALREQLRAGCVEDGHLCRGCPWSPARFAEAMEVRHPDRAVANPLQW